MERFENAQIDDLVWCRKYGNGFIEAIKNGEYVYRIGVVFGGEKGNQLFESYTIGGYFDEDDVEPMLFYRKGEEHYLTERPEPEIDWPKVKRGTMFYVGDTENPSKVFGFHVFDGERPWFGSSVGTFFDRIFTWKFVIPVNPSEVPYK